MAEKAVKQRILHKLEINEISGVDSPAQEGARMAIMKRSIERVPLNTPGVVRAARLGLLKARIAAVGAGITSLK